MIELLWDTVHAALTLLCLAAIRAARHSLGAR